MTMVFSSEAIRATARQYVRVVNQRVEKGEDRGAAETAVYEDFKTKALAKGWGQGKVDAYWNEVETALNTL